MTAIDITQLTPPDVIEPLDFEAILAERKAYYVSLYPPDQQAAVAASLELESEPVLKLLQDAAYRELVLRARYNDEASAVMLAFAKGADLDHIGVTYYREARLVITPANPAANPPVAEVKETDESYRERLQLKPESWSTAGPTEAYEFFARSAHGQVKNAKATSPNSGTTVVTVLSHEGTGVPSQPVLDAVTAALNVENVRPLSEEVLVQAAQIINYEIIADIWLLPGAVGQVAYEQAVAALNQYKATHHNLGTAIILTDIIAAAKKPGVYDVTLNLQANIPVTKQQAAWCTGVTVNILGVVQP
jgi:phage-related baseplate assembly protein